MGLGQDELGKEERTFQGAISASVKARSQEQAILKTVWAADKSSRQMRRDSLDGARSDGAAIMCWAVTRKLKIITLIPST